jgi:hypothetical protein
VILTYRIRENTLTVKSSVYFQTETTEKPTLLTKRMYIFCVYSWYSRTVGACWFRPCFHVSKNHAVTSCINESHGSRHDSFRIPWSFLRGLATPYHANCKQYVHFGYIVLQNKVATVKLCFASRFVTIHVVRVPHRLDACRPKKYFLSRRRGKNKSTRP